MSVPTRVRPARLVHAESCMGTVFTFDLRDAGDWTVAVEAAVGWLHHVDAVFSTYRPGSDVSRLGRGECRLRDCDPLVAEVLDRCAELRAETGGYFTATPAGRLDPSGFVKGWAVERASDLLSGYGARHHAVSGGGDMQLVGGVAPGVPWRVGIADPADRSKVVAVVAATDVAVATSGTAERGAHVVDPLTGRPADRLASVTVVGARLGRVDACATAAFAMGDAALPWLAATPDLEGLVVTPQGDLAATRSFPAYDGGVAAVAPARFVVGGAAGKHAGVSDEPGGRQEAASIADRRSAAAAERDRRARQRDAAAQQRDSVAARREAGGDYTGAAADREQAQQDREQAEIDREMAARDRDETG